MQKKIAGVGGLLGLLVFAATVVSYASPVEMSESLSQEARGGVCCTHTPKHENCLPHCDDTSGTFDHCNFVIENGLCEEGSCQTSGNSNCGTNCGFPDSVVECDVCI